MERIQQSFLRLEQLKAFGLVATQEYTERRLWLIDMFVTTDLLDTIDTDSLLSQLQPAVPFHSTFPVPGESPSNNNEISEVATIPTHSTFGTFGNFGSANTNTSSENADRADQATTRHNLNNVKLQPIPISLTEDDLYAALLPFGAIRSITIKAGAPRYAYVNFETAAAAESCSSQGIFTIKGISVTVRPEKPKTANQTVEDAAINSIWRSLPEGGSVELTALLALTAWRDSYESVLGSLEAFLTTHPESFLLDGQNVARAPKGGRGYNRKRETETTPASTLHASNFPPTTDEGDLAAFLQNYTGFVSLEMHRGADGKPSGTALLHFDSLANAAAVQSQIDGFTVGENVIPVRHLSEAEPPEKRQRVD
eukprot:TRINITY_DN80426_c0_g1_i1.p1 TRINITY_DN80426_c0_g1~~TRINITY_DN80426_c0_g1_i1.p1  ORF type:complete len:375 (-),score=63.53 TRINITY_DN80426_c0_g1_i1:23-1126(-)